MKKYKDELIRSMKYLSKDKRTIFLGQSVLRYQVPLDIYNTINHIYETKYPQLKPANKQLVGKIEKEHSLFFDGQDGPKMTKHNHLTQDVLQWFHKKFQQYNKKKSLEQGKSLLKIFGKLSNE